MVDNTNPLSFIFNGSDPNVNAQLRQRIALAMLAKQKRYPKTFGEGLSAIGEAIGNSGIASRLEQQDLSDQAADKRLEAGGAAPAIGTNTVSETPPPTQTAYAPPADVPAAPPPSQEPAAPTALAQLPLANNSEGLTNTPAAGQPPSTMFNPNPAPTVNASAPPAGQFSPRDRIAKTLAPAAGGYNLIDAQAGMPRQGQGRVQDAVEAAFPGNPDMQAYGSQLAAGEQQRPGEVSSTGARGPWQFVPGTAKQYGLNNPDDPMAAAEALKAFTSDNASTFIAKNGRAPTMAELAVMHQQGGTTGANMVAGTGNASPRNLSLNNVPPGASPAAAVDKIKGYYGLPDRAVDAGGSDPRQAITQALAPKPQVMAFDGQPTPPPPQQQIRQAPPQQQIAQAPTGAQPAAIPGYVPPGGGPEPGVPTKTTATDTERAALQQFNEAKRTGNTYTMERTAKILAQEAERRQYIDARNLDVYKEKLKQRDEANKAREAAKVTQASRITEEEKARVALVEQRNEAELVRRSNMKPEDLYKRLDADMSSADQAIRAQRSQALARKAIKDGVITGYGANMKIATAKFADWAFKNGLQGDLAANTEIMKASLDAGLMEAIKTVNGEGGTQVSNADVNIAKGIQGSDPNLQMKTIQTLMDRAAEVNFRKINRYEDYVDKTLGGLPVELRYRSTHGPTAPADKIKMLTDAQADPTKADVYRKYFDEIYGPGAAELELGRVERLARRKARGG